jgi:inosine/xanthosine triphosphate pyrophosphatase family protein
MEKIMLATSNAAKLARLRWLLDDLPLAACTAADLGLEPPSIEEDGADFTANAAAKALAWSRLAPGLLTLASDGGLEIPALGPAWVALRTRRNAGPQATDDQRIQHLLDLMRDVPASSRHTLWHEALVLARGDVLLHTWSASGDGGEIVAHASSVSNVTSAFWTERVRFYPAAGKLYCALGAEELAAVQSVWPRLRGEVRRFLRSSVLGEETAPDGP